MKITIKSTNLALTPSLITYIEAKLGDIGKMVQKFDVEGALILRIEVARTTKHHHKGDVFMAEADLNLPGKILRASENNSDIRRAIDILKHTLHLEIEKYKTQHEAKRAREKVNESI